MNRRTLKKVFLDSRFRYAGMGSDFAIELTDSEELPEIYNMYINGVSFPHSWYNVDVVNNNLYVLSESGGVTTASVLTLPPDNYSTLAALTAALDSALTSIGVFGITENDQRLTITSFQVNFRIPTRLELISRGFKENVWDAADITVDYDISSPKCLNDILNTDILSNWVGAFTTPIVDLRPHHSLYLHASLNSYTTLDCQGKRSIVQRIPVTVDYGYTVNHVHNGLSEDCVDAGGLRFKNLRFSLRTIYGDVVDLRGGQMTIEIIFSGN